MKAKDSLVFTEIEIFLYNLKHTLQVYKEALESYKDDTSLSQLGLSKAHFQRQIEFIETTIRELVDMQNALVDREMSPEDWDNIRGVTHSLFFGTTDMTPQNRLYFLKQLT